MFHHPIYNKRQEIGKDVGGPSKPKRQEIGKGVGGPSKPNHELSSSSSTNTAVNCKYTFHVQLICCGNKSSPIIVLLVFIVILTSCI